MCIRDSDAIIHSKSSMKVDPYASNWLERLRHIKRLRGKVLKEQEEKETSGMIHDFTGKLSYLV